MTVGPKCQTMGSPTLTLWPSWGHRPQGGDSAYDHLGAAKSGNNTDCLVGCNYLLQPPTRDLPCKARIRCREHSGVPHYFFLGGMNQPQPEQSSESVQGQPSKCMSHLHLSPLLNEGTSLARTWVCGCCSYTCVNASKCINDSNNGSQQIVTTFAV